jgi:hypothetical protein
VVGGRARARGDDGVAETSPDGTQEPGRPERTMHGMAFELLSQPYRDGPSALSFLEVALGDEDVRSLLVITAWVRRSGLELLVPGIDALRQRGGTARLIFGVDLKGTTRQGAELARRHLSDVHVFHDPAGGTFHPKLYLATTEENRGYALIGSNNLTAGGMWHNYETAVLATIETDADARFAEAMQAYADLLIRDTSVCKPLTWAVFNRLVEEGWLADESRGGQRSEDRPRRRPPAPPNGRAPLFSASAIEKRVRPVPVSTVRPTPQISTAVRRRIATAPDSWWKRLGAGEAQHPEHGHITGNIALTNVPSGQDRVRFFRDIFFAGENWRTNPDDPQTEIAEIEADVEIDDRALGRHALELVFRAYRQERSRATTVMRLDTDVREQMRARRVTGWYFLVERAGLGVYGLRITPRQPM